MNLRKTSHIAFGTLFSSIAVSVLLQCNTIPDTVAYQEFNPDIHDAFIRMEWCYLFNTEPGCTEIFGGICSSAVVVNGDTIQAESQVDSTYMRISRLKDTVVAFSGTTYGDVQFTSNDILSWSSVIYYLFTKQGFIGQTLVAFLDSADYNSMIKVLVESDSLTDSHKADVIEAFNAMINIPDFYYRYRKAFPPTVTYEKLSGPINRLVAEGIMLDTTGTVKSDLTLYEYEILKWFNAELIVRYLDSPPIVTLPKMLKNFLSAGHVHKMLFEKSTSADMADEIKMIRFISKSNSLLSQPAFIDHNGATYLNSQATTQKISDVPFISSSSATPLTPLYWTDIPVLSTSELNTLLSTGHATFTYLKGGISTEDTSWYCMKMYYTFTGQIKRGGILIDVNGTICSSVYLTIETNMSNSNAILDAVIKEWNTETHFELEDSSGGLTIYKKITKLKILQKEKSH